MQPLDPIFCFQLWWPSSEPPTFEMSGKHLLLGLSPFCETCPEQDRANTVSRPIPLSLLAMQWFVIPAFKSQTQVSSVNSYWVCTTIKISGFSVIGKGKGAFLRRGAAWTRHELMEAALSVPHCRQIPTVVTHFLTLLLTNFKKKITSVPLALEKEIKLDHWNSWSEKKRCRIYLLYIHPRNVLYTTICGK